MPKRGKQRWKDPAYTCRDCEAYYDGYSPEEKRRRVQASCRHRSEQRPAPSTPPGFWDIDFPSSPEILASGMMTVAASAPDEPAPPAPNAYAQRRRRRWRKLFNENKRKEEEDKQSKAKTDSEVEEESKKKENGNEK